jgi:phosphoserine aminotransferase
MVRGLSTIPSAEHMVSNPKPAHRPGNPSFSCGPCAKRPGWSPASLDSALVGRSHRSPEGRARLRAAIDKTRAVLRLPADYRVAIVPGSDTGAFEMCLWSMLGARGVDVLAWESFGKVWLGDVMSELKLPDVRRLEADFGLLPDMSAVDFSRDVVFTANGTTSGVRIPDYDWIAADRTGLTLVDATSAIFAQAVAWSKVDALTFSWQKVLGGEAAHGMVILSPRAVERLETYRPAWPLPKIFRMTRGGKLNEPLFEGETINTPSMLCVEDYINALDWAESLGGVDGLIKRAEGNAQVLFDWIERTPWVANLAANQATWSTSSVCLVIADPAVSRLSRDGQAAFSRRMVKLLDDEGVGFDIGSYRDAPPGLRVWTGATVEAGDLKALTAWLDWAFAAAKAEL